MSTTVTVAVAKTNHMPVNVYVQDKDGPQWRNNPADSRTLGVGNAETFLVHRTRRIFVEETV